MLTVGLDLMESFRKCYKIISILREELIIMTELIKVTEVIYYHETSIDFKAFSTIFVASLA